MSRKMDLCLESGDYVLRLPFPSIENVDKFTMGYSDKYQLLDVLVEILEFPYDYSVFDKVCLRYSGQEEKWFPIRYSKDNYNIDSLVEGYNLYLCQDQNRLNGYGIRNVVNRVVPNFVPGSLNDSYIRIIANRYLDNDYRKMRDVYFLIRKTVPIKIDEISKEEKKIFSNNLDKLRQLDNIEDSYIQYLVELSCRGEEEYQMAAEELAMMGLDAIERELGRTDFTIIDGVTPSDYLDNYDYGIIQLERFTGKSIHDLKKMFSDDKTYRRKR